MSRLTLVFLVLLCSHLLPAQKVGIVLSGGGASGLAHIGVLKALEEYGVPVDCITGTSMGALIGALYATGQSPIDMERFVLSDEFQNMLRGGGENDFAYYYKREEPNATWLTIKFLADSTITPYIPTNFISPAAIDYKLMEMFAPASAFAANNFDDLFVPFRCVAADITNKREVNFKSGFLNEAVRASMSYPFYIKPIEIDGMLLFDGGMYNNFPSNIMYDDFFPDLIIGSNVSQNEAPPTPDDVISQVKNMLLSRTDFSVICENGIVIEPQTGVSTFEFKKVKQAIDAGYEATIENMPAIKRALGQRTASEDLSKRREVYRDHLPPLQFEDLTLMGLNRSQAYYAKRILSMHNEIPTSDALRPRYFRLYSDPNIKFMYPRAVFNRETGFYTLHLKVIQDNEIMLRTGGNFSSRPINTGYLSLRYNYLRNLALTLSADAYFGRFYGSSTIRAKFDLPLSFPLYIEPMLSLNRWDWFKSKTTFFEDVKPSFLVQNDRYAGVNTGIPTGAKGKLNLYWRAFQLRNQYYQTSTFLSTDTADLTEFYGNCVGVRYKLSTLNRFLYADKGSMLDMGARLVDGDEQSTPGSTALNSTKRHRNHQWVQLNFLYEGYFSKIPRFTVGFVLEVVYSTQGFFDNYTSTILSAPAFQPTPESRTLFIDRHRAHKFIGFGGKAIFNLRNNLDFRLEVYQFNPFNLIQKDEVDATAKYGTEFSHRAYLGMAALVFHSPIGPVSLSTNYYQGEKEQFSFLFHLGYILFNERSTN